MQSKSLDILLKIRLVLNFEESQINVSIYIHLLHMYLEWLVKFRLL